MSSLAGTGVKWFLLVLLGVGILLFGGYVQGAGEVVEQGADPFTGTLIIGWQFHDDNVTYLSEMIDLAMEYNVNHVELSHNMIWHSEDILKSPGKQREINELIEKAHDNGMELFIWTHEISGLPKRFMVNGKTDLDNPLLWEWLKNKYEQLFEVFPDLDGMVLTFSETDIPVCEDEEVTTTMSKPERVAKILNTINEVTKAHNKKLWARTWGEKVECVAAGIKLTSEDIWVENKNVQSDFDPYSPHHPMTGAYGARPQIVEFDLNGQYLGRSWIPSAKPDYLKYRLQYAMNKGVRGFVGRVGTLRHDFEGTLGQLKLPNTHAINTPNEINLYAFSKIIQNPDIDTKDIWQEWVSAKYNKEAAPHIISAYNRTFEIARQLYKEAGLYREKHVDMIVISTHSDIPWWGVFDVSRPEGNYWKKMHHDPVFNYVVNGGNIDDELNARFDPIADLCRKSISDIESARPYLTQEQYSYLKEYLERELTAIQLFKQIKKVLIRHGMVEIQKSDEDKKLLEDDLQDLLSIADSIESKFGSGTPLFKPDDIRTFVNGFTSVTFVSSECNNHKCEPGENLWNCPDDCVEPYYDFIGKNSHYKKPVSEKELNNQIKDAELNPYDYEATPSELRKIIIQGLNIEFLVNRLKQKQFNVSVLHEMEFSEYTQKTLLFENPDVGTFNAILLIPKGDGPFPSVVGLHGHGDSGKVFMNEYFGADLAKQGFVVIMPSFRVMECGETERNLSETLLLNGFSLMGLRVYESLLLIEYLKSSDFANSSRIGVMGHSGGSTTSNLVARVSHDVKALAYDFEALFLLGCGPPSFIHCETVPSLAYYRNQINDASLLLIPPMKFAYGYEEEDDKKRVIFFFEDKLKPSSEKFLEQKLRVEIKSASKGLWQRFLDFLSRIMFMTGIREKT